MDDENLRAAAAKIVLTYEEDWLHPFPYADCYKLIVENVDNSEGLIPDLDLYFSEIAGYCSWGERIVDWSDEKVQQVYDSLQTNFFEQCPEYTPLQVKINTKDTPDLYRRISTCDTLRYDLRSLLAQLLVRK